jgi:hypothetical protein
MVEFQLKEVMEAVGPSAALAFAAWLFLQLLQQRYSAAYSRYRELVDAYRTGLEGKRREIVKEEILIYKKRVVYMMHSANVGTVAAMLLLTALVCSALNAVFKLDWLKFIGAPCIILGLFLVIPAAALIIVENRMIRRPIDAELSDLEEFNGQPQAGPARGSGERRSQPRPHTGGHQQAPHGA